jgi:hypothetical protein
MEILREAAHPNEPSLSYSAVHGAKEERWSRSSTTINCP